MTLLVCVKNESSIILLSDTAVYNSVDKTLSHNSVIKIGPLTTFLCAGVVGNGTKGILLCNQITETLHSLGTVTPGELFKIIESHCYDYLDCENPFQIVFTINRGTPIGIVFDSTKRHLYKITDDYLILGSGTATISTILPLLIKELKSKNLYDTTSIALSITSFLNGYSEGHGAIAAEESYYRGIFTYLLHTKDQITSEPYLVDICTPIGKDLYISRFPSFYLEGCVFIGHPIDEKMLFIDAPLDFRRKNYEKIGKEKRLEIHKEQLRKMKNKHFRFINIVSGNQTDPIKYAGHSFDRETGIKIGGSEKSVKMPEVVVSTYVDFAKTYGIETKEQNFIISPIRTGLE